MNTRLLCWIKIKAILLMVHCIEGLPSIAWHINSGMSLLSIINDRGRAYFDRKSHLVQRCVKYFSKYCLLISASASLIDWSLLVPVACGHALLRCSFLYLSHVRSHWRLSSLITFSLGTSVVLNITAVPLLLVCTVHPVHTGRLPV